MISTLWDPRPIGSCISFGSPVLWGRWLAGPEGKAPVVASADFRSGSSRSSVGPSPAPRRTAHLPRMTLGHLHIFEEAGGGAEGSQSVAEGDWARRFGLVFVPSAEFGDEPCCPSKRVRGMRVFLARGVALHFLIEDGDQFDLVLGEGKTCRLGVAAVAGLHELDDDGSGAGGNGGQLAEAIGGCQLAVFDAQSLELQGAEELLDDPALPVPADDPPGIGEGLDVMGGQQDPMDGLSLFWRMRLDDLDDIDGNAGRQAFFDGVLGPLELHRAEAERQMGVARAAVGPFAQLDDGP